MAYPNKDPDRFRIRRRMAVAAFVALVSVLPMTFAMIWLGGEHMGTKLLQGSGILAPVVGCLTALVWKYYGDVTRTDIEEMRHDQPNLDRRDP